MKRKSWLLIIALLFGCVLNISGLKANNLDDHNIDIANASSIDLASSNSVAIQADSATVTMRDIEAFLKDKKEHYPLSDEFIERYQQSGGGYIDTAKKAGLVVNKELHEPNQKWHFFESWLYPSIEDGSLSWDESAKSRVYSKLLCPELLLWIYEACGVDPVKVKQAKDVAEQGKTAKLATTTIAKNMRACVSWEDLENGLKDFTPSPSVTLNPSKLQLTVGEQATITAALTSSDITDPASWSVTEGEDVVSITPNGNEVTVNAIAKGTAKIQASYGDGLSAVCTVTVKEPRDPSTQTSAVYNLQGTSTAQIKTVENALATFKLVGEGDGIILSVDEINYIFGGGSGGSGDNKWSSTDLLKIGSTSYNGSITLTLDVAVSRIIITGYVHDSKCEVRVGDSTSTDWTDEENDNKTVSVNCSEMTVVSKDSIDGEQTSTIIIDFESASSITIATVNTTSKKYPFYITSIEFVVSTDTAQQ